MIKNHIRFIAAAVILTALLLSVGCAGRTAGHLRVATSTSLLTAIVAQIGGDKVAVATVVAPAQHPGDFDARPDDIRKLADADIFLVHGWPGETYVPALVAAADNSKLSVVTVSVDGNWMIPSLQSQAAAKVAAALSAADGANAAYYEQRRDAYQQLISTTEARIKARLAQAQLPSLNIIASDRQAQFAAWAGFKVIATYGAPESLTPQLVRELVDKGRQSGVALVIDNLQSGKDAGKGLAAELGSPRVALSNFPGGLPGTTEWAAAIERNIDLLLEALSGGSG